MQWFLHHRKSALLAALPLLFFGVVANRFSWRPRSLPRQANYSIVQVAFSPDGATLAAATRTKLATAGPDKVQLWDVDSGRLRRELPFWSDSLRAISFAPQGGTLATLSYRCRYQEITNDAVTQIAQHKLQCWDVQDSHLTRTTAISLATDLPARNLSFWPDADTLSFLVEGEGVLSFSTTAGKWSRQHLPDGDDLTTAVALSPQGSILAQNEACVVTQEVDAVFAPGESICVFDARTGVSRRFPALVGSHSRPGNVGVSAGGALAFSPNGKMLAGEQDVGIPANTATGSITDVDVTILLWDLETGGVLHTYDGLEGGIRALAFSPDSTVLAAADSSKNVKLYDVRSGALLRTLSAHRAAVNTVAFSPDGATLASGSADGSVKLWRVR